MSGKCQKVIMHSEAQDHIECEIGNLLTLPYENVATLMGYGSIKGQHFLITKWEHGGDLETRIKANGIAYALHMVHQTGGTCVLDLKPVNILLNEMNDPILCDLGLGLSSGAPIGHNWGTSPYHDESTVVTPARDIFGYGVTLFQIVSDEVSIHENRVLFSRGIRSLVEQEHLKK